MIALRHRLFFSLCCPGHSRRAACGLHPMPRGLQAPRTPGRLCCRPHPLHCGLCPPQGQPAGSDCQDSDDCTTELGACTRDIPTCQGRSGQACTAPITPISKCPGHHTWCTALDSHRSKTCSQIHRRPYQHVTHHGQNARRSGTAWANGVCLLGQSVHDPLELPGPPRSAADLVQPVFSASAQKKCVSCPHSSMQEAHSSAGCTLTQLAYR